jgi:hypothetical protein
MLFALFVQKFMKKRKEKAQRLAVEVAVRN